VVENLSRRCGGFLKSLSLRGCQLVSDNALRWIILMFCDFIFLNYVFVLFN